MQSSPFLILAIFGFPLKTPLPTRHVRSPLTAAQRAPCQKRGFDAARYQVARKRGSARHFLFRTTFGVRLRSRLEQIFCVLLRLSERSGTIEVHLATLSAQNLRKIFRSMLRDYVYLIGSMPTFNNLVALIQSVMHLAFRAVILRGRYPISPKRGWARWVRQFICFE